VPILSPEQQVGKAVTSLVSGSAPGFLWLNTEQKREFVTLIRDISVVLGMAQVHGVEGYAQDWGTLDIAAGQMVGGLGAMTAPTAAQEMAPTWGGRTLEPEPFEMMYRYELSDLPQVNREEDGLESKVDGAVRVAITNDLEGIGLNSQIGGTNPSGYNTGNLTTIDGWRIKANAGNVYDHQAGYVNPEVLKQLKYQMPQRWWRNNKADMVYLCSPTFHTEYRDYLSRRTTSLGDLSMLQENQITYAGIPLVEVPLIPDDESGTLTQSDSSEEHTWVMLVEKRNLILGFGPKMRIFVHPHESGKWTYYNWYGKMDVQFERIGAVCLAVNILPVMDPTVAVAY